MTGLMDPRVALANADDRELIAELQSRGIRVEKAPHSNALAAALDWLGDLDARPFRQLEQHPEAEEAVPVEILEPCIRQAREMRNAVAKLDAALRGLMMPGVLPKEES